MNLHSRFHSIKSQQKSILLSPFFDTSYQTTQKINAQLKAGTRSHVFCLSNPTKKYSQYND